MPCTAGRAAPGCVGIVSSSLSERELRGITEAPLQVLLPERQPLFGSCRPTKAMPAGQQAVLYPAEADLKGERSSQIGLAMSAHVAAFSQLREPAALFIAEGLNKLLEGSLF